MTVWFSGIVLYFFFLWGDTTRSAQSWLNSDIGMVLMWPMLLEQICLQVGFLLLSFAFTSGQRILSVVCKEKVKSALAGWISSKKIPLSI